MKIKVAAAQYPITLHQTWEDWKLHVKNWVDKAIAQNATMLVFPEYGSMELVSLFSLEIQADLSKQLSEIQTLFSDFCACFAQLAIENKCTIVAPSFPFAEVGKIHNRVCVFDSKGFVGHQDKFFMTRFENEIWGIQTPSKKTLTVFDAAWGSFGIQTCYDIEFSIGSQQLSQAGAQIIFAPSCTEAVRGATRVHVSARARAIENQCYTVVSQTVGNATWSPAVDINFGYAGFYSTADKDFPEDGILKIGKAQSEEWMICELDIDKILEVRDDGQVLNFKDHQKIENSYCDEEITIVRKSIL